MRREENAFQTGKMTGGMGMGTGTFIVDIQEAGNRVAELKGRIHGMVGWERLGRGDGSVSGEIQICIRLKTVFSEMRYVMKVVF